jgi:alpha(1,3/1,4) fucosyltransferase
MKRKIHLDFADFGRNASKQDNFFYHLLSERFNVELCDQPNFLIYSEFGHSHRLHNCIKIFYTWESTYPDFSQCDYAITTHYLDDPRNIRLPYYVVLYPYPDPIIKQPEEAERILAEKKKFCSFMVSNHNPRKNKNRVEFFHKLSKYKRVDSGGRLLNNIGGPVPGWFNGKVQWLKDYKFNIAFENASIPGYTTEKIVQAMMARSLPIYWGNPRVHEEFNPRSFLNRQDFSCDEELIEKIIRLDTHDDEYLEYVRQPYLPNNQPTIWYDRQNLLDRFERIFDTPGPSIMQQRRKKRLISFGRWLLVKRHHLD